MGLKDVVFGVATCGLYNIGKAAYQGGNAAEDMGKAAEQAGTAIAVIGSTIEALGEQLSSLLEETEELITIKRMSPRDEDELWDEEKERLADLREEKEKIEAKLKELGVDNPDKVDFDFWDMLTDWSNMFETFQLLARLTAVNSEIAGILYQEPGVLTEGIYCAKEVLERFNTLEQPKIEDILDSLDDNLEVSEEVMQEVKKLFVTKKKVPIPEIELSPDVKDKLGKLELDKKYYEGLLGRKEKLALQFAGAMEKLPEKKFEISGSGIKIVEAGLQIPGIEGIPEIEGIPDIKEIPGTIEIPGIVKDPEKFSDIIGSLKVSELSGKSPDEVVNAAKLLKETASMKLASSEAGVKKAEVKDEKVKEPAVREAEVEKERTTSPEMPNPEEEPELRNTVVEPAFAGIKPEILEGLKFSLAGMGNAPVGIRQPQAARISASMNTKFDGFQKNYEFLKAQTTFYERQLLKLDRRFELLNYRWEDEPGIIPQTLDEVHDVLERLHTEEQPRIDAVLDTLNANLEGSKEAISTLKENLEESKDVLSTLKENLEESKEAISKVNASLDSMQGGLSFFEKNSGMLRTGALVLGGLVVLNLFFGLIVLFRAALGI
ncbi:MAG: hypothetical protein AB3K77_07655 [Methanosarcinaceae archaeon]